MGTAMLQSGHEHYGPYFHAYRRAIFPQLKNRLTPEWTFDDLAKIITLVHGVIMICAGLLIATGSRLVGPCLLILEMEFIIVMQDNPLIVDYLKPKPKSTRYRWDHLARHLSVIGCAVLMMAAPSMKSDEEKAAEKEAKKVKAE